MIEGFYPTEEFDIPEMGAFMRRPDIYGPLTDALAPPAEAVDFESYMVQPTTYTMAAMYGPHIVGYCLLALRTGVAAELQAGFHPQARGIIAKTFTSYCLVEAWKKKGLISIWAFIAADNRPARHMVYSLGFRQEGRLRKSITRSPEGYGGRKQQPGLYDLLTYAIHRPGVM